MDTLPTLVLAVASLIAVLSPTGCSGLLIRELTVPAWVPQHQPAVLTCRYDAEGQPIYSVKWYRAKQEFYRYLKDESPNIRTFPMDGVHVDVAHSNDTSLRLTGVTLATAGEYTCEVSVDAPTFLTAVSSARLNVAILPKKGPHISGLEEAYAPGQTITANCTVGAAVPRATLRWFLNGAEVDHQHVQAAPGSPSVAPLPTWAVLRLPVAAAVFNKDRNAELRCSSTIGGLQYESASFTAMLRDLRPPGNQRLAQYSAAGHPAATPFVAVLGATLALGLLRSLD